MMLGVMVLRGCHHGFAFCCIGQDGLYLCTIMGIAVVKVYRVIKTKQRAVHQVDRIVDGNFGIF